jgi:hypothetical protein
VGDLYFIHGDKIYVGPFRTFGIWSQLMRKRDRAAALKGGQEALMEMIPAR